MMTTHPIVVAFAAIGAILSTYDCSGQQVIASASGIYNRNLVASDFAWCRILEKSGPMKLANSVVTSTGPWDIDTNHTEYGLLVGPVSVQSAGSCDGGLREKPSLADASIQIRATFVEALSQESPPLDQIGARLVFWFQTELPSEFGDVPGPVRYANYIWNENLLTYASDIKQTKPKTLKLSNNLADWTCLGRQRRDIKREQSGLFSGSASKYSCALNQEEFATAVSAVTRNMGLLIVLPWVDLKTKKARAWASDKKAGPWTVAWDLVHEQPVLHGSTLVLREFKIVR